MATRQFDFVNGVETSTLPSVSTPFDTDNGIEMETASAGSVTVDAGDALMHYFLSVQAAHTYTVNGKMIVLGDLTIAGTISVANGAELRVIGGKVTVSTGGSLDIAAGGTYKVLRGLRY